MDRSDDILDPFQVEPPAYVEPAPTGPPWKAIAAVITALVALVVFALTRSSADDGPGAEANPIEDTRPSPPVTESPTTTSPAPTLGTQLYLVEAARFPDGVVLGSFELGDHLLLFQGLDSFAARNPHRGPGMRVHQQQTDGSWVDAGVVLPEIAVTATTLGPDALHATGLDGDDRPVIASSTDGLTWTVELLPDASGMTPVGIAVTDRFAAVAGQPQDPFAAVAEVAAPVLEELGAWAWAVPGSDGVEIVGPLGYRWATLPYADLDLGPGGTGPAMPTTGVLWTRQNDSWVVEPTDRIDRLTPGNDGEILREGVGEIERSTDGDSWTPVTTRATLRALQPWRDGYLGFGNGRTVDTFDADLQPGPVLRVPQLAQAGTFGVIQTGPIGIGMVTIDIDERPAFDDPAVIMLRDDAVVTFHRDGRVVIEDGDRTSHEFGPWNDDPAHGTVDTDIDARTLTFLDPADAEPIVTFTYDELERVAGLITTEAVFADRRAHLLFSRDGTVWSRNNLGDFSDDGSTVSGIHVGDDALTMFVTVGDLFPGGEIEVIAYTAELPADEQLDQ